MLVQRISYTPAAGKGLALRAVLEEVASQRQAEGYNLSVSSRMYGAEPQFTVSTRLEDMAALEAYRAMVQKDPQSQVRMERTAPLMARAPSSDLWNIIVPLSFEIPAAKVVQRAEVTPLPGHSNEVRAHLEARATERQAKGLPIVISASMWSGAARFAITVPMGSLVELEALATRNTTDAAVAEWHGRLNQHLATSADVSVAQVIVSYRPVAVRELATASSR